MKTRLTHLARLDLLDIKSYLKESSPDAVRPTLLQLQEYMKHLEQFPYSGIESSVEEARELKTSKLPYIIIYRVKNENIEIIRIHHTSRKPFETE